MTTTVIAGASGFMGRDLVERRRASGDRVLTVGRGPAADAQWDDEEAVRRVVDGADLLVNLAGRSVNCRYGARNRETILHSRVDTTRQLAHAIEASTAPPRLWINSSTATIYRHAEDRPQTEATGELGSGFSVDVARAWEEAFFETPLSATRRVALRTAIVLGPGSVLDPLARLVRLGLGGAHLDGWWPGSRARRASGTFHEFAARGGRQRFSWVHLADVDRAIRFLESRPELEGPVNLAAPHPSDDRTVMRTLRRVLGVPFGMPQPRWMLELGAWLIGTETELVLKSRWVVPERLSAAGFEFEHRHLESALREIVESRRRTR